VARVQDALDAYLASRKALRSERWAFPKLSGIADVPLAALTASQAREACLAATKTPGSAKRVAAGLSAALAAAGHPLKIVIDVPRPRKPRFLARGEFLALLEQLPKHQRAPALFGVMTGLRAGTVRRLEWNQVRDRFLVIDETKNGEQLVVPLSDESLDILAAREGLHPRWVFTYRGHPVGQFTTKAWRAACARCGLQGTRWHDLRHTWASWHAQGGTPLLALMELGGWKSLSMVRRYAHFSPAELQAHALRHGSTLCSTVAHWVRVESGGAEGDRTLDLRIANARARRAKSSA
jgi:integrase